MVKIYQAIVAVWTMTISLFSIYKNLNRARCHREAIEKTESFPAFKIDSFKQFFVDTIAATSLIDVCFHTSTDGSVKVFHSTVRAITMIQANFEGRLQTPKRFKE